MPIEIRELHIRVSVSVPGAGKPAGAPGPPPGTDPDSSQELVAECVERVLQILRDRKER